MLITFVICKDVNASVLRSTAEREMLAGASCSMLSRETLNKAGPALLPDLNLIRETTLHDFAA